MFGHGSLKASHVRGWVFRGGLAATLLALTAGCVTIEALASPPPETPSPVAVVTPLPTDIPPAPTLEPPAPTAEPATPTAQPTAAVTAPPLTPEASLAGFDPLSEDALLLSMLDPTDDVDASAETSGVDVGTEADDLPAFAEQGGLRRAAQTISVGSDYTVYDFRYQFPDATSAAAFLDAEADNLGETHAFAVESVPPSQLGDDTRYYTSHTEIFVIQDSFNYLIRVENVVAKVWVGGDPEFINADQAFDIASSAWVRMTLVFDPSEIEGI